MLGALLLAAPFAAHAAKIYKWTDAQGNVIYTDTPLPGAVELHTPTEPAGVVPVPPGERTEPKERAAGPAAAYDALTVMAPADGEVLQNTEGWVDVSLSIAPALRVADGHAFRLRLDGQTLDARYPGGKIALSNIPRGEHTLEAEVVDRAGAVLVTSAAVDFSMHQASAETPTGPDIEPRPRSIDPRIDPRPRYRPMQPWVNPEPPDRPGLRDRP